MTRLHFLSFFALLAIFQPWFCQAGPRLMENDLHLPNYKLHEGVPLVDPPRRTAGYFKLDG